MKPWVLAATCAGCLFFEMPVTAQTSMDVLEQDLKEAKQKHDDASSQLVTSFISTLDAASQSPSQALQLYKAAGGKLPDAAPVKTRYEHETPTEKAAREAQDAASSSIAALAVQIHCGLMRYAAQLTVTPQAPGLHDNWINWLKATGSLYPQLAGDSALKSVAMRDSVISSYLGFRGWGEGDEGKWTMSDLPRLYRELVLDPARTPPTADTLGFWDTYIAMRQADEPDKRKWAQDEEPELEFDRDTDDFAIQPSMDKLSTLIEIIKANPSHSKTDDWITRMHEMMRTYQNGKSATTTAAPMPEATPSTPSSEVAGTTPAATPGGPSSASPGPIPAATPGTPSSGTGAPIPAPAPAP
jgi:hypothetical protein